MWWRFPRWCARRPMRYRPSPPIARIAGPGLRWITLPSVGHKMRTTIALLAVLLLSGAAFAQEKPPVIPSDAAARARTPEQQAILDASTAELTREMQLLGIKELRPPRNAVHPGRPDFANYDEAKAN